ncbi:hypothetical protein TH66_09850 [Carbonactinospora thermoautotrophica]|uniref:Transcriptional regulator n=1 Tax=Carbonactinospora thermoautotrophica TaxID=1469144 RepID=A0A132MPK5_9ACTN|nr:MarR family transcriptional regulator [Carbonactinospora thermoautotrophica]KWW99361.1 Transcriptional regulator [Carbonactinospora thermoautotrophica]KWX04183.1 hypothetical protein TH66_09850 [Carbonactinospora thermoautotrophica]KWX06899.1 hypothetical protein TR74_20505 [Carbonactinospora thermoautotrophica]
MVRDDLGWTDPERLREMTIPALLNVVARLNGLLFFRLMDSPRVSSSGMSLLITLARRDGVTSREAAQAAWCTPATLTGIVDTLERDGLVERRRDGKDRRVVRLHITEAGRELVAECQRELESRWSEPFDFIEPEHAPVIRDFLITSIERLGALLKPGERT